MPTNPRPHASVRALFRALPILLLLLGMACRSWQVDTGVSPADFVRDQSPERIRVVRTDNTSTELWNPVVDGDSLRGHPTELAVRPVAIPLENVSTVATRRFSLGKTALMVLAIGGGLVVYDLLMSLNETSF